MVKTQVLDERIEKSGLKIGYICDNLGISRQAFNRKVKGNIPFRVAEVYVICDLLGISSEEKNDIFFAKEVQL